MKIKDVCFIGEGRVLLLDFRPAKGKGPAARVTGYWLDTEDGLVFDGDEAAFSFTARGINFDDMMLQVWRMTAMSLDMNPPSELDTADEALRKLASALGLHRLGKIKVIFNKENDDE